MRAVVVYESMYGNTHAIAQAIGEGLQQFGDAVVVPVERADAALLSGADLVVVGGPTHAHGMSHAGTRKGAVEAAEKPDADVALDADAPGPGLREWLDARGPMSTDAAAFDTRFDMSAAITGRASKGIARKLRHHGAHVIVEPQSFFVTKQNHLEPDEEQRAREWGTNLGLTRTATSGSSRPG
jgi:hypothetical protein